MTIVRLALNQLETMNTSNKKFFYYMALHVCKNENHGHAREK